MTDVEILCVTSTIDYNLMSHCNAELCIIKQRWHGTNQIKSCVILYFLFSILTTVVLDVTAPGAGYSTDLIINDFIQHADKSL